MSSIPAAKRRWPALLVAAMATAAGACGGLDARDTASIPAPNAVEAANDGSGPERAAPGEEAPRSDRDTSPPADAPTHPLERFFRTLASIEAGGDDVVRVLHVGDSHAASDTLTGRMRSLLSARFGSAGRGYLYPGLPWDSYRQQHAEYGASGSWSATLGVRRQWSGALALGGVRMDGAEGAGLDRAPCDRCTVATTAEVASVSWLAAPGAGRFVVTTDLATVEVDAAADTTELRVTSLPTSGPLAIEVVEGSVSFFGTALDAAGPGVTYEVVGMNGGRADQWTAFDDALARA